MKLLLVEDDIELCNVMQEQLMAAGYEVDVCHNAINAGYYLTSTSHDMILLDRMLPGKDGMTFLAEVRQKQIMIPVIVITAMNGIYDRVDGLDAGADDYVVKPFAIEELLARIRALSRRPRQIEESGVLHFGDLSYQAERKILGKGEDTYTLSKRESALLEFFLRNAGQVVTREQILERVWGLDGEVEEGNIDNYIYFLRKRLRGIHSNVMIQTVYGIGYRLEVQKGM
ncbi:response regulator transcription factor [Anaerosporobacter faecicola]|uniref:response regulator transcription factor n=1 Tax=Anaerosporobacter faecicola TaxID=2718714 RepID=UPI0014387D3C|nr:response regulator transcription factor [Anaerosporobacter faecicola]